MSELLLAWRPFLDPLNLHGVWWAFLVPLSLGISVAYKAVRVPNFEGYWRQVALMTVQIILGMVVLWVVAFIVLGYVIPLIVPVR